MLKYHRNSDICKYKKQRNRVNNLKKIAKENFQSTISSFSINFCLSTLSYNQTSRLNETETLFGHCKKATEASRGQPSFFVTLIDLNGRTMNTGHD
jgi:hypothetical protein